jgi:hypothetical protein
MELRRKKLPTAAKNPDSMHSLTYAISNACVFKKGKNEKEHF